LLDRAGTCPLSPAGRLEINIWGGRSKVQLRLEDAARA
jgi:single-stranded-DNA-specific exonuclease